MNKKLQNLSTVLAFGWPHQFLKPLSWIILVFMFPWWLIRSFSFTSLSSRKKKGAWLPYILQWTRWKFSISKTGSTGGCLPLGWILVHVRWTKMFIFASLWCSPLTLLGGKLQTWVAPIKIQPSMLGRFLQLRGRIWPRGDASLTVWRVYKCASGNLLLFF